MRVLSWIGYTLAAILALILGGAVVIAITLSASFLGALVCIVGVIMFVASMIKGLFET